MSLEIKLKEYEEYKNLYKRYEDLGYPLDRILTPKKYFWAVNEEKYTPKQVVNRQILYKHSAKVGKIMRDYYRDEYGENLPIWKLRIMDLDDSFMKDIKDKYESLRKEMNTAEARKIISQKFFGSE